MFFFHFLKRLLDPTPFVNFSFKNFEIELLTWHKPDDGTTENVHELDSSIWKKVEIINIDITDPISTNDYKEETDPL